MDVPLMLMESRLTEETLEAAKAERFRVRLGAVGGNVGQSNWYQLTTG